MAGRRSNRSPLWRLPVDREVDEEMRFHLDMRIREYRLQGLSAEEAERRALARFGDRARHAASCRLEAKVRNRRWSLGYWFDEMSQDVRFGVRQLRRRPWLALCLVGLLAVGLGSTAAVAVLLEQGLWQPPPFDTPQDLMTLWEHHTTRGKTKNSVGPANFLAWREETQTFSQMAGFITISVNLTGGEGPPQRLKARLGTEGYLDLLGAPPVLGRYFLAEDFIEGAESTVVLSQALWQQRFGGRRDIVGDQVAINGEALRVVGVASSAIHLDMGPAISPYGDAADVFLPLPESAGWRQPRGRWLMVLARVVPGVTVEAARADLAAVMDRQVERHARFNADWASQLVPLLEHLREPLRLPLLALFGAVSMLLLIVCLNASSLLFSRTLGRSTELAVRNALGAGRQRLARQLLVEGLVLVTAAGGLAWLLAGGILRLARATFPPELLPAYASGGRGIVWLVALALAGFCIMLFGLLPGLALSGRLSELAHAVSVGGSRRRQRLRSVLVFSQVALALMLLVGAGLMLRTVRGLLQVDPGFEGEGVVSFSMAAARGLEDPQLFTFYDELLARLGALPDVASVGAVTHLPMASLGAATSYFPMDRSEPEAGQAPVADIRVLRGDYLGTLGIPLLSGRAFDSRDRAGQEPGSILISRAAAERHWPGDSAIGRELRISWGDGGARRVIGVVGDVHHADLLSPPRDAIYFPQDQERERAMTVVLRTSRTLRDLAPDLRGVVTVLDPALPIYDLRRVDGVVSESLSKQRFLAAILGLFALLALSLAALGIYGITALSVHQSTREIGLRMALGASPWGVAGLFLRRTAVLTVSALALGGVASVLLGRSVESLLFGVRATDPVNLLGMALLLAIAALIAALVPARRAARLDPTVALRWE